MGIMSTLLPGLMGNNQGIIDPNLLPQRNVPPPSYERQGSGIADLLGIKGKARDVIGNIGDAFLVQSGNAPIYAPHQRRENINEAMFGFADNPLEAMKRVSEIDPAMGMELLNKHNEQQAKAQETALGNQKTQADIFSRIRGAAGGLMHGANEATYGPIRERALMLGKRYGVNLAEFLPEQYDENAISAFVNMGVGDPDKLIDNERDQEYKDERLTDYDLEREIRERNVDSQIGSRATRDAHSAARVAQGDRRTSAYESRVANQNARPSGRSGSRGGRASSRGPDFSSVPAAPGRYEMNGVVVRRTRDGKLVRE